MNEISKKIFEGEPKKPKSIQIEFDINEININKDNYYEELFKMLLEIFYDGMRKFNLENDGKVDLIKLSDNDFMKIREYFWSIGYDVYYKVLLNDVELKNTILTTKNSDLKDFFLNLKVENYLFTIIFDILK